MFKSPFVDNGSYSFQHERENRAESPPENDPVEVKDVNKINDTQSEHFGHFINNDLK